MKIKQQEVSYAPNIKSYKAMEIHKIWGKWYHMLYFSTLLPQV